MKIVLGFRGDIDVLMDDIIKFEVGDETIKLKVTRSERDPTVGSTVFLRAEIVDEV